LSRLLHNAGRAHLYRWADDRDGGGVIDDCQGRGDVDGDGQVAEADLLEVLAHFGRPVGRRRLRSRRFADRARELRPLRAGGLFLTVLAVVPVAAVSAAVDGWGRNNEDYWQGLRSFLVGSDNFRIGASPCLRGSIRC
jgi:hypothetical protein